MKKILALLVAVVMVFSIAAIPVSAVLAETAQGVADTFNSGDYLATLQGVFALVREFIEEIHNLVGNIMGVVGEECAFCNQIHAVA